MEKIAFLTDIHLDEEFPLQNNVNTRQNWERALADVSARKIKKIIFGGDIGEATAHNWFFETLRPFSLQLILGNHDDFKQVQQYYKPELARDELYYSFEDENYKYLFLDSSSDELSQDQLSWLSAGIKTSKKLLLFIHHPILGIETYVDQLYPLKNRTEAKEILIASEVDVTIFCGHYHMSDERSYNNIKQVTTQSLSFQLNKNAAELKVDNSTFGYRILTLEEDNIRTELITFKSIQTQ